MFWRSREAAVFLFIFPLLLYALLGSVYGDEIDGVPAADILLAGLFGYGAATTAFAGVAIYLVSRREAGVLKLVCSTPLPTGYVLRGCPGLHARGLRPAVRRSSLRSEGSRSARVCPPTGSGSQVPFSSAQHASRRSESASPHSSGRPRESRPSSTWIVLPMAFLSGLFGPTNEYPAFPAGLSRTCFPSRTSSTSSTASTSTASRSSPIRLRSASSVAWGSRRRARRPALVQLDAAREVAGLAVAQHREVVEEHRDRGQSSGDVRPGGGLQGAPARLWPRWRRRARGRSSCRFARRDASNSTGSVTNWKRTATE